MSSGGWEIVCKHKKDKTSSNKNGKLTKTEKKKFIENAPKLEDFLPLSQIKTIYDNLEGDNNNKKTKDKENKTKENEEKKKQQKQNQQRDSDKKKQQQQKEKLKEKSSKTLDKSPISADQINELLDTNKTRFPDAPLIWLKDLVAFVNKKIPAEKDDPSFQTKPESYPLSLITKAVRTTFEKVIKSSGQQNVQLFYEGTLILMTKNLAEGSPDMGCKIFLQLLAQMYPEMTTLNIEKHISLRNSYQNKKPIGMSLLWALSQGGKKNLSVGLTLWHEVMAPMLESRTYASHVMKILRELLATHENVNTLTGDMYIDIVDDFYSGRYNIPTLVSREIIGCLTSLRAIAMKSEKISLTTLFETLIDRITPKMSLFYREELLKILVACIVADARCLSSWTSLHSKHLYQSELLLKLLDDEWHDLCTQVQTKVLKEALENIQTIELKTKKSKEEALISSCRTRAEALTKKMTASKKKESTFPWKRGSIFLLLLIGAVVAFDCRKHGSFEASSTGKLLKNSGAIGYGNKTWSVIKSYTDKGLAYLEASSPEYYKYAADLGKQYSKLIGDIYLVARNLALRMYKNGAVYVEEKRPLVVATIEAYFPGWLETFQKVSAKQLEALKIYSAQTADYITEQSNVFIRWLNTTVFVGNMSPENIRGYATKALMSTRTFAFQTYDWVYEKVQTLSKVQ